MDAAGAPAVFHRSGHAARRVFALGQPWLCNRRTGGHLRAARMAWARWGHVGDWPGRGDLRAPSGSAAVSAMITITIRKDFCPRGERETLEHATVAGCDFAVKKRLQSGLPRWGKGGVLRMACACGGLLLGLEGTVESRDFGPRAASYSVSDQNRQVARSEEKAWRRGSRIGEEEIPQRPPGAK